VKSKDFFIHEGREGTLRKAKVKIYPWMARMAADQNMSFTGVHSRHLQIKVFPSRSFAVNRFSSCAFVCFVDEPFCPSFADK